MAGGVAVFSPRLWFSSMSVHDALRWSRFYQLEPWGNREAGIRTGLLAFATGEIDRAKVAVDDFVVAAPTEHERRNREQVEGQIAEFYSWRNSD